jgi:hypothetical protein
MIKSIELKADKAISNILKEIFDTVPVIDSVLVELELVDNVTEFQVIQQIVGITLITPEDMNNSSLNYLETVTDIYREELEEWIFNHDDILRNYL